MGGDLLQLSPAPIPSFRMRARRRILALSSRSGSGSPTNLNVRGHAPLQVKSEFGIGNDVGVPVTRPDGFSRQVVDAVELMEENFDTALLACLSPDRRYVGDSTTVHGFFDC